MSSVQEIETALRQLPKEAQWEIARWLLDDLEETGNGLPEAGAPAPSSEVKPGDVGFDAATWAKSFCIFYGSARPRRSVDEIVEINIFAKINEIDKMVEIGKRIRVNGTEKIRMNKLNP